MTKPLPPLPLVRVRRPGARGDALPRAFGKYTLLRKLATGGMAELYLALHRAVAGFEKLVVIKRILPAMNEDPGFIDLLLHEARIAATLSHPNIVQIFDVDQVEGTYFIAMEHVHGEDLRSIVRHMKKREVTQFPLEHALTIVMGACSALAYAHDKTTLDGTPLEIVHRDISPQNVVVTFSGDVKVVDFGIAKSTSRPGEETKSGQLKGKVAYMSPEQAMGEEVDHRTDIFALGVVLFELTTGRRLFKGESEFESLKLICERQYPLPSQVRPGYSRRLEAIVMKALAREREDRYQSARELQSDLQTFVRDERIGASQVSLSSWMQALFDDQLETQRRELQEAKQLADVIAQGASDGSIAAAAVFDETGEHEVSEVDAEPSVSAYRSTTAATRSIEPEAYPASSGTSAWKGVGIVAFALLVAGLGVVVFRPRLLASQFAPQGVAPGPSVAEVATRGRISVVSDPPGATIWLDGNMRAESTPAVFEHMPVGRPVPIKLMKDGFEAFKQDVTLTNESTEARVMATLRKGSVTVQLRSKTPAVTFWLDGKQVAGPTIEGVSAGEDHRLVVAAPGFIAKVSTFRAGPSETKSFDITLEKNTKAGASPSAEAADPSAATKAEPDAMGKLTINAWGGTCNVSIDGAARGSTPMPDITLPLGYHTITCKPESGTLMTQTVKVEAGQTARAGFIIQ